MRIFSLKPFTEFIEGEEVLHILRRHRLIYFLKIFNTLFVFAVIGFVLWLIIRYINNNTMLSAYYYVDIILVAVFALFLSFRLFVLYIDWKYDNLIITNKRLIQIDQHFLFGRDVHAIYLKDIYDIKSMHKGIIPSVFGYAKIVVETSSAVENDFNIKYMPNPDRIIQIVHSAQQKERNLQPNPVSSQ